MKEKSDKRSDIYRCIRIDSKLFSTSACLRKLIIFRVLFPRGNFDCSESGQYESYVCVKRGRELFERDGNFPIPESRRNRSTFESIVRQDTLRQEDRFISFTFRISDILRLYIPLRAKNGDAEIRDKFNRRRAVNVARRVHLV